MADPKNTIPEDAQQNLNPNNDPVENPENNQPDVEEGAAEAVNDQPGVEEAAVGAVDNQPGVEEGAAEAVSDQPGVGEVPTEAVNVQPTSPVKEEPSKEATGLAGPIEHVMGPDGKSLYAVMSDYTPKSPEQVTEDMAKMYSAPEVEEKKFDVKDLGVSPMQPSVPSREGEAGVRVPPRREDPYAVINDDALVEGDEQGPPVPSRRPPVSPQQGEGLYSSIGNLSDSVREVSEGDEQGPPLPNRRPPVSPQQGEGLYSSIGNLSDSVGEVSEGEEQGPPIPSRRPPVASQQYDEGIGSDNEFDESVDDIYTFVQPLGQDLSEVDSPAWAGIREDYLNKEELNKELLVNDGPLRKVCDMIVQSNGNLSQHQVNRITKILRDSREEVLDKINEPMLVDLPGSGKEGHWGDRVMPLLHAACLYNVNPEVVQAIVNAGGNFGLADATNRLPLHHAAINGSSPLITMCLNNTDPKQLNVKDVYGVAPVTYMVSNPKCSRENVEGAMKFGADFGVYNAEGQLPIHCAARNGSPGLIKHLLFCMQNSPTLRDKINDRDIGGNNIAHYVASNPRASDKLMRKLSTARVDLHAVNNSGKTPLCYAVVTGSKYGVDHLLKVSAREVNAYDNDGYTPLHHAVMGRSRRATNQVMHHPLVDCKAFDANRRTPLHHAVMLGSKALVRVLSNDSGKPENIQQSIRESLLLKDGFGNTPLHLACTPERMSTISSLLKAIKQSYGLDGVRSALLEPNIGRFTFDMTSLETGSILNRPLDAVLLTSLNKDIPLSPLHAAVQGSNVHVLDKILENAPSDVLHNRTPNNLTSIQVASMYANPEMIKYIAQRSSPEEMNDNSGGPSPLHMACLYGYSEHVKAVLTSKHVDCNQKMGKDQNALIHYAVVRDDMSLLKMILKRPGIDVNAVNANGETALHLAAEKCNVAAVEMLSKVKGVDLNIQDAEGRTPASIAISENIPESRVKQVIKLLARRGADLRIDADYSIKECVETRSHKLLDLITSKGAKLSSDNQAPLEFAIMRGDVHAIKRLSNAGGDLNHIIDRPGTEEHGLNFLMLAIKNEKVASVEALVKNGADPTRYDRSFSRTPMHMLVMHGNQEFACDAIKKILSQSSENVKNVLSQQDVNGDTPLHVALKSSNLSTFNRMVKNLRQSDGSRIYAVQNEDKQNLMHVAVERNSPEGLNAILKLSKQNIANIASAQDKEGNTALHIAVRGDQYDMAGRIINAISKNSMNSIFCTQNAESKNLLHIAAGCGNSTLFDYAVKNMSKDALSEALNARDKDGNTPLHIALAAEMKSVKKVIPLCSHSTLLTPNNEGKLLSDCIKEGSVFKDPRGFVSQRPSIEDKLRKAEEVAKHEAQKQEQAAAAMVSESSSLSSSSSSLGFLDEVGPVAPTRQKKQRFSDSSERSTTEVPEVPLQFEPREYSVVNVFTKAGQEVRTFNPSPEDMSPSVSYASSSFSSFLTEPTSVESESLTSLELDKALGTDPSLQSQIAEIAEGMSDVVQSSQSDDVESGRVSPSAGQSSGQKKSSCMEK
ncbi:hypothetical protein EDL79_02035 [Ehrlichia ruminantium]|uniref:Uncharacterized protein n=1 Tax=Ehrlichia ruminantium TaxID=779 RepID=A0AAE6QB76_EHRRU|nr:ankyrin repeat domain-containing protein [Ehrlichia ruminantium]QGR02447.1 hypothetical protein EDL81_02040 [Ehrlichia ruminantium]QGR03366.1 hypothetical protein EDL80_02035 [Ehrlichia ruminantium]QGR04293.1 hypothetical protein EDL79_02035 [Ehrlichia ruminantium]